MEIITTSIIIGAKAIFGILLLILIGLIYFAPYRLAKRRKHPHAGSIFIVTLFTGFTGIGWILAYAWAHTGGGSAVLMAKRETNFAQHPGGRYGR